MTAELKGRRVVVTRARAQAAPLAAALRAHGAEPIIFPTIEFTPLTSPGLEDAIAALESFDWIVFPSANAVTTFCDAVERFGAGARLAGRRLAAVGPGTADQLGRRGLATALIPERTDAAGLAQALGTVTGARVLIPRSRRGLETLPRALREGGALVTDLPVYDTVTARPEEETMAEIRRGVDVVTVTSPSALEGFLELLGADARPTLTGAVLACIGETTASAARRLGLRVDVVASEHTVAGLVAALVAHFVEEPA